MTDLGVGLVGCGKISGIYLDNAPRLDGVRFVACTDVDAARRRRSPRPRARALSTEELVATRRSRSCSASRRRTTTPR